LPQPNIRKGYSKEWPFLCVPEKPSSQALTCTPPWPSALATERAQCAQSAIHLHALRIKG
ncbi:hypothetical protein, partial [Pseudomonas syringae]|uniref:hypothetical protein n=1 Tax=Pseudomonas syringae TaxID=317 RepID=UPI001C80ACB5